MQLKLKDLISIGLFMRNEVTCERRESVEMLHKQKGSIANPPPSATMFIIPKAHAWIPDVSITGVDMAMVILYQL